MLIACLGCFVLSLSDSWDTAGHERFKCIAQSYYRNASVVVVAFDMTRPETLLNGKRWLDEALRLNTGPVLKFLVGTKKDLLVSKALNGVLIHPTTLVRPVTNPLLDFVFFFL